MECRELSAWTLARVPRITHEAGGIDRLGPLAAAHVGAGGRVLLVADPGLAALGIVGRAEGALRGAGLAVATFTAFKPDPTCAQADAGAALAREHGASLVVGIGGGSALDIGKAIAVVAAGSEPAAAYVLGARPLRAQPLRKLCVPTTAGTGSETTRTAVLTDAGGAKVWLWGDELKADDVLLDPMLSVSLPAHLTAATGLDALVHAIEACTNANAFPANDAYCHAAIQLVARWLPRAVEAPDDLEARANMLLAAAFAGIGIDNAGTAIAHNIGHALGSLAPVHHGRAVAVAMRATLAWNVADEEGRWRAVARLVGVDGGAGALPSGFAGLMRRLGVEGGLGEAAGISPERLAAQMARPENASMRRSNRRPVGDDDLLPLARATLEAD